jgi:hypothetical protein
MAKAAAMDSSTEAQYRNLAIFAAECRTEKISQPRKEDLQELIAIENAESETGSLASEVESNLPRMDAPRHSDPSTTDELSRSCIAANPDTKDYDYVNMKPKSPETSADLSAFWKQRKGETVRTWRSGQLLVSSKAIPIDCGLFDKDAARTPPTVKLPGSPCCAAPERLPASILKRRAVPISSSTKPVFVFDGLYSSVRGIKKKIPLVWIKSPGTDEEEARIVELEFDPYGCYVMYGEPNYRPEPETDLLL